MFKSPSQLYSKPYTWVPMHFRRVCLESFGYTLPDEVVTTAELERRLAPLYERLRLPEGLTADRILAEHRVAIAPGEGFGQSGAGWARLSLAVADDVLDEGIERLERHLIQRDKVLGDA